MDIIKWLESLGATRFEKTFKQSRQTFYAIINGKRPCGPKLAYMIVKATNGVITYEDIFNSYYEDKIEPIIEEIDGAKQLSFFDNIKTEEGEEELPAQVESN